MTVGGRLFASLSALVLCTVLVGAAALAGLRDLQARHAAVDAQQTALRGLFEIGHRAATARLLLANGDSDDAPARAQLAAALQEAEALATAAPGLVRIAVLRDRLAGAVRGTGPAAGPARLRADVNRALGDVARLAAGTRQEIADAEAIAAAHARRLLAAVGGLVAVTAIVAAVVGVRQYRAVVPALRTLVAALDRVSSDGPGVEVAARGDRELRRLVHHFNRTSRALAVLHASMREQVEAKSRDLVRSEQLAGVGILAAGLAHEINNPLGIIAGHAEKARRRLHAAPPPDDLLPSVDAALAIIADEAFRCRDITRDLLRLAQPDDGVRHAQPILPVVERAVGLVGALPAARGRRIELHAAAPPAESCCAIEPAQILQVVINLLTNALEACPAGAGRVMVEVERRPSSVAVVVGDDGRGMTAEVLAHAFDPFFTDKPRRDLAGCGLGLALCHAIVERHGGRMHAASDGPGRGSRVGFELPVAVDSATTFARATGAAS